MQKDDASPPTARPAAVDAGSNGDADLLDGGASTRHAYEELRRQILFGELEPGATFSQVQLSTQLGVSRTPLREAVRLLQTEGLLRSEPRRRVRVSPITTDDFEDLYAMRVVLDSLAVRLTVPVLSSEELAEIRIAYLEATVAAGQGDVAAYRDAHRRFHSGLFAHAGARLVGRVQELWDHAERYRLLHMRSGELTHQIRLVQNDHAGILEAAEQRDAVLAAKRTAEHLARTALMTLIHIDPRHEPARVRAALAHVDAEAPTADGASAKSGARSAATS
jgi:DNA-binding GntR family transcriptional regulator